MSTPQQIEIALREITYELGPDLDHTIANLEGLRNRFTAEGYSNFRLDVATRGDYEGGEDAYITLYGQRMETLLESETREYAAKRSAEWAERRERQQFEALKKKFEPPR